LESGNEIDGFAVLRVWRWILGRLEAILSSDLSRKAWWLDKKGELQNSHVDKISDHSMANIHLCMTSNGLIFFGN
jgi:DNA-binding PadR family transcriptional regulator